MPDAAQSQAADAKRTPGAIQARFGGFCWIQLGLIWLDGVGLGNPTKPGKAGPAACLLWNQERIQGLKNAPIARFGGLGCYRSGSGKRWLATGERGGCETGCWAAVMQGVPDEMLRVLQAARETGLADGART